MREPLVVASAAAIGVVLLHAFDPRQPGHYPTCPVLAATGLYCPGCGALRAVAATTDGDLAAGFGYHPLVPLLLVVGVIGLGRWSWRRWQGAPGRVWPPGATVALLITYAVLFVARNIPGWTWLSPA